VGRDLANLFGEDEAKFCYHVYIDKRWQLDDLSVFSKAYEETYFALFGLLSVANEEIEPKYGQGRISRAFRSYPWRGGYSALNFFGELKRSVPKKRRPTIS
jgi:hypothetical protein